MVTSRGLPSFLRWAVRLRILALGAGNRTLSILAPFASEGLRKLPFGARLARFLHEQTWSLGDADMLDRYLVSGYQNPRINVQSILIRHFLISKLFGSDLEQVAQDEVRFAVMLNELLRQRALALRVTMGSFLNPAKHAGVQRVDTVIAERQMEFEERWQAELANRTIEPIRVLEFACGSANDFRAFVSYGLAGHLDYTGVDLTPKNIENALRRFPHAQFEVGNILDLSGAPRLPLEQAQLSPHREASSAAVLVCEHDPCRRVAERALRLSTLLQPARLHDHRRGSSRLIRTNASVVRIGRSDLLHHCCWLACTHAEPDRAGDAG